jgi:flagellar basal-body rod protein FlgF
MIQNINMSTEAMNGRFLQQEIIANNLANVSTAGFKRDKLFRDALEAADSKASTHPVTVFEQGNLRQTESPCDLAVSGDGFFAVQTPDGVRYTRNGRFTMDAEGFLATDSGYRVLGDGGPVSARGKFAVSSDGTVTLDNTAGDKIKLVAFEDESKLKKSGVGLFEKTPEAVEKTATGEIRQGFLEESNVNAMDEMVSMMTVYRYFEADQRVLQSQDAILNKVANDIGRVN